jgi:hypothetical protein
MDLFLDEAGYTGSDLINRDQPMFILGSTVIEEREARALLESVFGRSPKEVKYSKKSRSSQGRRQILEFLHALDVNRRKTAFFSFHKEFLLLTHLIDYWVEPAMREGGVNLYARGGNIAYSNVCYLTLGTCLGREGRHEFLRRFQVMIRDRTPFTFRTFWDSVREVKRQHELVAEALGPLEIIGAKLGYRHLIELPEHVLDVSELGLLQTIQHWRTEFPETTFLVIHDQSNMLERRQSFWEAILDPANPAATVGQDRRSITFPLPVQALRLEESHRFPQLQVADLIAGAARSIWNARISGCTDEYNDALVEAGLLDGFVGGVGPTASVTPADLDTEGPVYGDMAEFVSELVKMHGPKANGN